MAVNFINSVKPNNSSPNYYLQNCDVDFVIDNRTTSGAALTGVCHKTELYDGMQIVYWLVWDAGSNATLNLTLGGPDGTGTATTGAIPCYYSGSTRLTTHYPAGNAVRFTYRKNAYIGTTLIAQGWWADANYYSDSNYDVFASAMKLNTALYAYSLCAITNTYGTITPVGSNLPGSYWEVNSFTQSGGYSVTTKKATTKGYIPWKLFWNSSSTDLTTAHRNTSTISGGTSLVDLRYTVNGTDTNICTARAPFFLVGSIGSDGLFYLKGNQATTGWWQSGVPTTATNDVYWFVGMSRDAYRVYLAQQNWFYKFVDGVFTQFDPMAETPISADYTPVAYDSSGNVIDLIGFGISHYTKTGSQVNVWLAWSSATAPASITLPFTSTLSLEMVGTWVDTYAGPDYGKMAPVLTYADGSRIIAFNGNFNLEGKAVISYYI